MTSEGDSGVQPQAELNAMADGEPEAVSSSAEAAPQQNAGPAATPNGAQEENVVEEGKPQDNEDITATGGGADSNGVTDGGADIPFPRGVEGGAGEESMREPTLAHCVESEQPSAPARESVIASVKVLDTGEKTEIQADFDASATAVDVQQRLAGQLQVKPDDLQLMVCGKELMGAISLTACPRNSDGSIVIDAITAPAKPQPAAGKIVGRNISVVRDGSEKPYLGGYRNKNTGTVFHNACAQTQSVKEAELPKPRKERFCREAQTVDMKGRSTQSKREFGTQMPRPDLLLDTSRDRVVTVGSYFTATELEMKYDRTAVTIQRYARGFIARKQASKLKHSRDELNEFLAKQAEREAHVAEKVRRSEVERRMRPRTTEDFEVLYNELEAWRLQQTRAIHAANLPEENRRAAMQALLHKETRLLQTIDRLKRGALEQNKKARVDKMMRGLASPKSWSLMNGRTVSVHTPLTTRARELMHLYHGLTLPLLRIQERLDVLLHVKWTVKEFDCNLTREIVDLIDREADLLNRGRSLKSVDGLRRRIAGLFLAFIETPEFNPEAAALQVLPDDPSSYLQQGAKLAARA